jgi:hypothetical protein
MVFARDITRHTMITPDDEGFVLKTFGITV